MNNFLDLRSPEPGFEHGDYQHRYLYNRLTTVLDRNEFNRIATEFILDYNATRIVDGFPMESGMGEKRVGTVPLDLWNLGIEKRPGQSICQDPHSK